MLRFFILFLSLLTFSCIKTDIRQFSDSYFPEESTEYNYNDQRGFCIPNGWGRKGCLFLAKYDGTFWADTKNYYSDFSDIQFVRDEYFISLFNIKNDVSYCRGWRTGENISDGKKWNIKITKDEWDTLWFDYNYFGTSNEIEYSITYKYEVIDSLLHFSNTEGQEFIFHPSDKNYSKDFLETDNIIEQEGCTFY